MIHKPKWTLSPDFIHVTQKLFSNKQHTPGALQKACQALLQNTNQYSNVTCAEENNCVTLVNKAMSVFSLVSALERTTKLTQ